MPRNWLGIKTKYSKKNPPTFVHQVVVKHPGIMKNHNKETIIIETKGKLNPNKDEVQKLVRKHKNNPFLQVEHIYTVNKR